MACTCDMTIGGDFIYGEYYRLDTYWYMGKIS
jgi:hypothetical protein